MSNIIQFFKSHDKWNDTIDINQKIREVSIQILKINDNGIAPTGDQFLYLNSQLRVLNIIKDSLIDLSSEEKYLLSEFLLTSDKALSTSYIVQLNFENWLKEPQIEYDGSTRSDMTCLLSDIVNDFFEEDAEY